MSELTIYYDLEVSPPTYDVVSFLCRAECERIAAGADSLRIVILPGPDDGFRRDNLWPRGGEARRRVLNNVAVPLCRLLPSVSSVEIQEHRTVVPFSGLGIRTKMYGFREQVRASAVGVRPLRSPTIEVADPTLITITLREAEHWPERNSDLSQWLEAARVFLWCGMKVVFVRDTEHADEPLDGFETDRMAATDIAARADLYARAGLNLFVSNGPAWLCMAMNLPTAIFRPAHEGSLNVFASSFLKSCGVPPGGQMPGSPDWQRLVWQPDHADVIVPYVTAALNNRALCA